MLLMETNLIEKTQDRIKKHEGYRNTVYKCSEGFRTIGYGHRCFEDEGWVDDKKYPKEVLEKQFKVDFTAAARSAEKLYEYDINGINPRVLSILTEMVFQLGPAGVGKFKKMLKAITMKDYLEASKQMLDSRWAKQTPKRAENLASEMAKIV